MIKNISLTLTLVVFLFPTTVFAESISVTVKGMVCSFCAQGIKKTFSKKPEVDDINVDLDKKVVKIKTKDGSSISDDEIRSTIADAGYDVLTIERDKNA